MATQVHVGAMFIQQLKARGDAVWSRAGQHFDECMLVLGLVSKKMIQIGYLKGKGGHVPKTFILCGEQVSFTQEQFYNEIVKPHTRWAYKTFITYRSRYEKLHKLHNSKKAVKRELYAKARAMGINQCMEALRKGGSNAKTPVETAALKQIIRRLRTGRMDMEETVVRLYQLIGQAPSPDDLIVSDDGGAEGEEEESSDEESVDDPVEDPVEEPVEDPVGTSSDINDMVTPPTKKRKLGGIRKRMDEGEESSLDDLEPGEDDD
jgi:hypothetical protein